MKSQKGVKGQLKVLQNHFWRFARLFLYFQLQIERLEDKTLEQGKRRLWRRKQNMLAKKRLTRK